ncbi:11675_t:CDS:2, partial [Scutellospora calospora]
MNASVKISLIDLNLHSENNEITSDVETLPEIGASRSIKEILAYLIPTMSECRKKDQTYYGVEKYSILQIVMKSLIAKLDNIKNGFIDKEGHYWNINLYFSADWKFMLICLGHKAANSAEYCLWCLIHKSQNGILESNGILDELYLLLRVTDQLWTLVINELYSTGNYNDIIHKDQNTKAWAYTPLIGDDKLKILQNFNFIVIFSLQRAALIRKLWNRFYCLYNNLHNSNITGKDFYQKACSWLQLFLTRSQSSINSLGFVQSLYCLTDVTSYIHVLVYHVPEFIDIHKNVGFNSFSCSAVEKKNYEHISHFFQKTMKNGGNKSAIIEIMEYENQNNFFYINDIPLYFEKD